MFIDMHVHPAFYEPINQDSELEELRHNTLDIHKNGTAPLEHIFNQMKCAGLDYFAYFQKIIVHSKVEKCW